LATISLSLGWFVTNTRGPSLSTLSPNENRGR